MAQALRCTQNPQPPASVTDTCVSDLGSLQTVSPAASAPGRGHITGAVPSPYAVKNPEARLDCPGAAIPHPWVLRSSRRPHPPPTHSLVPLIVSAAWLRTSTRSATGLTARGCSPLESVPRLPLPSCDPPDPSLPAVLEGPLALVPEGRLAAGRAGDAWPGKYELRY